MSNIKVINATPETQAKSRKVKAITVSDNPIFTQGASGAGLGGISDNLLITHQRITLFWDIMDTIKVHGYLRASISVIGRSMLAAWWTIVRDDVLGEDADDKDLRRLYKFFKFQKRDWNNFRDWYSGAYKYGIGVMYLRAFGQCAYQVIRSKSGRALGLDFLHGLVVPNIDNEGNFVAGKAFTQYPHRNSHATVEFEDPRDIVYIINPDFMGSPLGGTDLQALSEFNLPLDLMLQSSAKNYMLNRDKPELIYQLSEDISDEAFDAFVEVLENKYSGYKNVGRNPVVVAGELKVQELAGMPTDLPYAEARQTTTQELFSVVGISGAKLGITSELAGAGVREARREFHETTMTPLFRLIQEGFYEQVIIREFGIDDWKFAFGQPDFLTRVERATVQMRLSGVGALSPNEIRNENGQAQRTDPEGNLYVVPKFTQMAQGSPPEGRDEDPGSPSNVGEPTIDDQDPPRGDNHDDGDDKALSEVRKWQRYTLNRMNKGKQPVSETRDFNTKYLSPSVKHYCTKQIKEASGIKEVTEIFEELTKELENEGR